MQALELVEVQSLVEGLKKVALDGLSEGVKNLMGGLFEDKEAEAAKHRQK